MPFTFVSLFIASWFATRKLESKTYLITGPIVAITALSITFGPLKLVSIHMNFIPILLGGILGAYIGSKSKT
jgi:uncharacterized membrane protein